SASTETPPSVPPPAPSAASSAGTLPAPVHPPPAVAAWPDSLAIYVAPALLLRPTTPLSPGAGGLWGFTKMLTPSLGVDVSAVVPVVPAELSTADGRVKIAS